jgi:hypothetical protein
MTNFEGSKEEEKGEKVWPSLRYNSGMPFRGMEKNHNT